MKKTTQESNRVISRSSIALLSIIILVLGKLEEVDSSCIIHREGYKCEATEASSDKDFKVTISNKGSEDVRMDVFKKVGDCKRGNRNGPPPLEPPPGGSYERDLTVSKGEKLTFSLEKGQAPYCSVMIIRNCRKSANQRVDCSSLLTAV